MFVRKVWDVFDKFIKRCLKSLTSTYFIIDNIVQNCE